MGSTINRWQALLLLGEKLIALDGINNQIALLEKEYCEIVGAVKARFIKNHVRLDKNIKNSHTQPEDENSVFISVRDSDYDFGELQLLFENKKELSDEDWAFIKNSAELFGTIFSIGRHIQEKQSLSDQLVIIRSSISIASNLVEQSQPYQILAQKICQVFDFSKVEILIKDQNNEQFVTRYQTISTQKNKWQSTNDRVKVHEGVQEKCFNTDEIIFAADLWVEGRSIPDGLLSKVEDWAGIPIQINEDVIGALCLWSKQSDRFSPETIEDFSILPVLISTVYRNSRLLENVLEQSWISNVLQQISEVSLRYESLEDQLNEITRIIPLMIDIEKCAVFLTNNLSSEYIYEAQFGYADEDIPKLAMLPYTREGSIGLHALEVGKTYIRIPSPISQKVSQEEKQTYCILFALTSHEKMHGVMLIDMSGKRLNEEDERFNSVDAIQTICHQIALSIENFHLIEEKEIETYTTTVLLQSAEAIALAADIEEALENICNLLPFFIGVDTTIIYLMNPQQRIYHLNAYQSNSWKTQSKNLPIQFREGNFRGLDEVLKEGIPSVFKIKDVPPEDWLKVNNQLIFKKLNDYQATEPLLMLFPLHIQSEISGFMLIREAEDAIENREKKIEILNGIARQISVAVQNVQLKFEIVDRERMHREIQFAQEIQRTFLPEKNLEISGYQTDTLWRPALQLGGDFYDMFPLVENKYGFVIADVSDKGMPAALYMTVSRTLIHAAAKKGIKPAETLLQVNQQLIENSSEGLFVTVIYGILDANTGGFIYTNAGHNKPILLRDNKFQWLEKGGMPLGISDNLKLEEHNIKINPSDEIILYTDGVTECRSSVSGYFGEERLENILRANMKSRKSISNIKIIDEKLLDFLGKDAPSDDVTILTIRHISD